MPSRRPGATRSPDRRGGARLTPTGPGLDLAGHVPGPAAQLGSPVASSAPRPGVAGPGFGRGWACPGCGCPVRRARCPVRTRVPASQAPGSARLGVSRLGCPVRRDRRWSAPASRSRRPRARPGRACPPGRQPCSVRPSPRLPRVPAWRGLGSARLGVSRVRLPGSARSSLVCPCVPAWLGPGSTWQGMSPGRLPCSVRPSPGPRPCPGVAGPGWAPAARFTPVGPGLGPLSCGPGRRAARCGALA